VNGIPGPFPPPFPPFFSLKSSPPPPLFRLCCSIRTSQFWIRGKLIFSLPFSREKEKSVCFSPPFFFGFPGFSVADHLLLDFRGDMVFRTGNGFSLPPLRNQSPSPVLRNNEIRLPTTLGRFLPPSSCHVKVPDPSFLPPSAIA